MKQATPCGLHRILFSITYREDLADHEPDSCPAFLRRGRSLVHPGRRRTGAADVGDEGGHLGADFRGAPICRATWLGLHHPARPWCCRLRDTLAGTWNCQLLERSRSHSDRCVLASSCGSVLTFLVPDDSEPLCACLQSSTLYSLFIGVFVLVTEF